MQRRVFLKMASGLYLLTTQGLVLAADKLSEPKVDVVSTFAWATDVHHCRKPADTWDEEGQQHHEVFSDSLEKFRRAVAFFKQKKPDFSIELGDFKDCTKDGTREQTIALLDEVETIFRDYDGPRYHVAGNHDFDKISLKDFLAHTTNAGAAAGKTFYSFVSGEVKYIVLDGCYNTMDGQHYDNGNLRWDVSMVPHQEVQWLQDELNTATGPVIVFIHQLLNSWDSSHGNLVGKIPDGYFIRNAAEIISTLEKSGRVLAVFSGHYHSGWYSQRNGIHYVIGKGLVENPLPHNVAGFVQIDRNGNIYIEGLGAEPSRNLSHTV